MIRHTFRYTNKQRFTTFIGGVFTLLFFIAAGYIAMNIRDFWETHAWETVLILVLAIGMIMRSLSSYKGKESKDDLVVTNEHMVIGNKLRIPLTNLQMDIYTGEGSSGRYHLYSLKDDFTLYTNEKDALINHLLSSDISQEEYEVSNYSFNHMARVSITAGEERKLAFNLDTGKYSIAGKEGPDSANEVNPGLFMQTPTFRKA